MEFMIENIITLLVVVIILVIYRQLDKNNRFLEKIKRYSEKIKDELDIYVESKTVEVKNFAIELDVHKETGKAILNRLSKAEDQLESKATYIGEMYERINEYDTALSELTQMTLKVQDNLERLHEESEFVDKVGKRVKDSGHSIIRLEKEISSIKATFAKDNIEELKVARSVVLEDTQKIISNIHNEIAIGETKINDFTTMVKSLENTRDSMEKETIQSVKKFLDEQFYETQQSGEQMAADILDKFNVIIASKTEEAESVETGMKNSFKKMSESFTSNVKVLDQKIIEFKDKAKAVENIYMESLKVAAARGEAFEDEVFDSLKGKISLNSDTVRKEFDNSLTIIDNTISAKLSEFSSTYTKITDTSRKEIEQISEELNNSDSAVRDRISSIEARVHEYEDSINYKFTKLEDIGSDIDSLENNLRVLMAQAISKIDANFNDYEIQQDKTQQNHQEKVSNEMNELYDGLNNLEVELNGLKSRAYENVAKGLKIFEDDFFSDLKNKNIVMEEKLVKWQGNIDKNLEELASVGDEKRLEIEKEYSKKLRDKLEDLQERVFSNQLKFENKVVDFQTRIEERMSQTNSSIGTTEESIKNELMDIQESVKSSFSREFVEFKSDISTQLKKADRDLGSRLKSLAEILEQKEKELLGFTENTQSEVTIWQVKILQELKESQTEITSGYEDLKDDVFNNIAQIKGDFESQKEDLIISTQEERARIKNELKDNASGIVFLQTDLRNKTETAIENFNREYETFILEIQKKNRDMQVEFDKKIKDLRLISYENKSKADQLQKKLYGKIEENSKILAVNLQEIDKRQKSFINQTKIFDRADSLKISLQESIEDLKSELAQVEAQGNEAREIKRRFNSIYKLGDEVNMKLERFISGKRRIEEMEGDFKKLIIISQSVDTKLRQVTASHDDLQSIQIKIKDLEELEKEVSIKFDRLEKKDQIIENTTTSVDKNFQQLTELDDKIRSLHANVTQIPDSLHDISSKIELLSRNKSKADETITQVAELDGLLKDIEKRIKNMEKARKWLAKTETRMEEISKQAQEQVKLLGTILKDSNTSSSGNKGVPSMGVRDVVTRLAHQGWSIQEIASTTKLSRGEVELILELMPPT